MRLLADVASMKYVPAPSVPLMRASVPPAGLPELSSEDSTDPDAESKYSKGLIAVDFISIVKDVAELNVN